MKVLIFIGDGFEDSEFLYPYYRFQEAGFGVDVVGSKAGTVYKGKNGVPFKANLSPKEAKIDEYEAMIVPGGMAPDKMRTDQGLVGLIREAYEKGKVIAAICHGPQMLIEADIIQGRKATCWKSVATDLKNAGATYVDAPVVVDGKLVTSRFPPDLPKFCKAALELIGRT